MSDYLEEIEAAYSRCRERHSMLSPLDWHLAGQWEKDGIPVFIVLAAIDDCCKKYKARKNPGSINTLRYFEQAVRQRFAGWNASRVGAHDPNMTESEPEQNAADYAIERCEEIILRYGDAKSKVSPELREALTRVTDAVFQIILYIEGNGDADAAARDLAAIEQYFDAELLKLSPDREEVLARLRKKYPEYAGTDAYDKLLLKELYDRSNLPRLTLINL